MPSPLPSLNIMVGNWSLFDQKSASGNPWSIQEKIEAVAEQGFEAFSDDPATPGLKEALQESGLRYGGGFDAAIPEEFETKIRRCLEIDHGPINCQLCDHDTPTKEAIELTIALMEEAHRQGATVHLEAHRDTCTETPEKLRAIAEGFKSVKGHYPRINFDFSHPAIIKHLNQTNYADRLFENIPLFQQSTLWHMRPFNGHHCQIPITDGNGNFSPEYEELRPFICHAFALWLQGPRPGNTLWVIPELGPKASGYGLSCFPDIWEDLIVLGNDLKILWAEVLTKSIGANEHS